MIQNMELAPISITTYNRLEHLKRTVESLKKNKLAEQSVLYIFSDAPKLGDEEIIKRVRQYCDLIAGFKEVIVVKQKFNDMHKNIRDSIEIPLNKHGKMIWMEDDNITSPSFLEFMNTALVYYENNDKVIAIGGHCPNLKINMRANSKDIFFVKRFHPWGYATWKHKFLPLINRNIPDEKFINIDNDLINSLCKYGNDLLSMVRLQSLGKIEAGDIKLCYWLNKIDKYVVIPTQTLVKNIGLDGSGVHCSREDKYKRDMLSEKKKFDFVDLYFDENIQKEYKKFYDAPSFIDKLFNKIIKILKRN